MNKRLERFLLGLGLDCRDGHVRVTRGKNFHLVGGSDTTHKCMQEKAMKFNEQLKRRGKTLDEINVQEFHDIAHKIGLKS